MADCTVHVQGNTLVIVILLSDCLQYSNSAMNPVLYAFLSDNFKGSQTCDCTINNVNTLLNWVSYKL